MAAPDRRAKLQFLYVASAEPDHHGRAVHSLGSGAGESAKLRR